MLGLARNLSKTLKEKHFEPNLGGRHHPRRHAISPEPRARRNRRSEQHCISPTSTRLSVVVMHLSLPKPLTKCGTGISIRGRRYWHQHRQSWQQRQQQQQQKQESEEGGVEGQERRHRREGGEVAPKIAGVSLMRRIARPRPNCLFSPRARQPANRKPPPASATERVHWHKNYECSSKGNDSAI